MKLLLKYIFLVLALILMVMPASYADKEIPIPDPLVLSDALLFSEKTHPKLSAAEINIRVANDKKAVAESEDDFDLYLEGRLRYVQPSAIAANQNNDDHRVGIVINKNLYDFGRLESKIKSADFNIRSENLNKQRILLERRLEIQQRFYDVVLADMDFYRYNEEMATEFVSLDRLQDQLELGQKSDIDIMEKDVSYKKVRYLRIRSQNEQRITRARLAIAMGRPGELVNTVSKPKFSIEKLLLPNIELLNEVSLKNNFKIATLGAQLSAAREQVILARKKNKPTINLEAASFEYSRQVQGRYNFQVGVVLQVPLFAGHDTDIETASALSKVHLIEAEITLVKANISASILSLWLEFDALKGKLVQMKALTDYREIYLDRSRALYELEVKTDLGDAMVRVSEAEREYLQTEFQMMVVLAKLELDVGLPLKNIKAK